MATLVNENIILVIYVKQMIFHIYKIAYSFQIAVDDVPCVQILQAKGDFMELMYHQRGPSIGLFPLTNRTLWVSGLFRRYFTKLPFSMKAETKNGGLAVWEAP